MKYDRKWKTRNTQFAVRNLNLMRVNIVKNVLLCFFLFYVFIVFVPLKQGNILVLVFLRKTRYLWELQPCSFPLVVRRVLIEEAGYKDRLRGWFLRNYLSHRESNHRVVVRKVIGGSRGAHVK